jgi:general secretion pathway protein M
VNVEDERVLPLPDNSLRAKLSRRWEAMAPSERRAVSVAAGAVGLLLAWLIAVNPALSTLREAPKKLDRLDAQLQRMQRLSAEAKELRAAPPVPAAQAAQALQSATERLGNKVQLSLQGDNATLTINAGLTGDQLRGWLAEARSGARARPTQLRLTRGPEGYTGLVVVSLGGGA